MIKRPKRPKRPTLRRAPPPQPIPGGTELTCYVHEGWAPRIAPASSRRDWMEATPDRYAYRCLPLAIANAHGWEVLSPCGFEARWTGGQGADSVEIRLDPGTEPHRGPTSLFGSGTITFHIEGIFRTSPGWNLWLSGPPNSAKDGIAPLGGVIETDWSPYTFTMNWRFTRPDHWVRFEENEPICFFFPVQRGVVDGIKPELRPMEDAPELLATFSGWSAARAAFQDWVKKTSPTNPTDQWQKLYYRGLDPQGKAGAADHQSKVRPPPFVQAGSRLVCPVTSPASRKPPPPDPKAAHDSLIAAAQTVAAMFVANPKPADAPPAPDTVDD
jgi:hypothetical protein